jgi:hypothetical protein
MRRFVLSPLLALLLTGATTVSQNLNVEITQQAPPGACPMGNAYADGCPGAPTPAGTIQYPALLAKYGANRPPWNVAGADYYVGRPNDGQALTDWRTIQSNPNWYNLGGNNWRYTGTAPLVMDHFDFTTGTSGWSIYTSANTPSITITNSKIGCVPGAGTGQNAPAWGGLNIQSPSAAFVFKNNTVDYTNCQGTGGYIIATFGAGGGACASNCSVDFEYNFVKDIESGILYLGGAQNFVNYKYNLIVNPATGNPACPPGTSCAVHMNTLSWAAGTGSGSNVVISFNTIFWDGSATDYAGGEYIQMYWNGGGTFTSPTVANNTFPLNTNSNVSYVVHGQGTSPGNTLVGGGTNNQNYFDLTGVTGAYYPGTMTGWASSRNINLITGATITPQ